ncbi:MAG: hypothetical protein LPK80_08350 [Bacteroidota bacterium]|nr:hypothetical protein [Bacteroidota bacterium]MDX5428815.1 hypothetical protein [Bacteroidota bacterium]
METSKIYQPPVYWVFIVTGFALSIPLIAMQFTVKVNWDLLDFSVAGLLLVSSGLAFRWLVWKSNDPWFRIGSIIGILAVFLLIWSNLAVGLIGCGPNLPNLLFGLIPLIGIIGAIRSHFSSKGLFGSMVTMAIATLTMGIVSFLLSDLKNRESSFTAILLVTGFFSFLFLVSALFFKVSEKRKGRSPNPSTR